MISILALTAFAVSSPQGNDPLAASVQHALEFSLARLDATTQAIASNRYPSTTTSSGTWATTSAGDWTSGFFPGCLWLAYDSTGDAGWRAEGEAWLVELEDEKDDTSTHDVGFKIFPSFGNAYRTTGVDAWRSVVLDGAAALATRYSPIVHATRSWNGPTSSDFRVIIDNMMNLEILFFGASHGGNAAWRDMAIAHALTTRASHVRPDGSTYQVVNFDPSTGAVKEKSTHQGFADESTWARGQGWAVYGFTMAYRESGDARFLETARACADFFVTHLPADAVAYWDLELPSTAGEPRDSSAAAVAAAGLLELAHLEPDPTRADRWLASARAILTSLCSPAYLSEGSGEDSILLHGTQNRPDDRFDTGLIYGDYYFLEALLRYQRWFGVVPVAAPIAVETGVGVAVEILLTAADAQECELVFSIVDAPAHGSLGVLVPESCASGTPNRDAARVLYFPAPGFVGSDSFSYRASDGTHASEPALVTIDVGEGGGSLTFQPVADSKVNADSPTRNYGTEATLRTRAPSPEWRSYLQFQVAGLAASVSSARLRLFATDGSDQPARAFACANAWTESGLTWSNAPAPSGAPLAIAGPVGDGAWLELDVTDLVTGNGTFSVALTSASTNSAYFSAREGAQPPELVVTVGGTVPDTTPPTVESRTPGPDATDVPRTANVVVSFDEPVLGVGPATFLLRRGTIGVAATVGYDPATRTATLDPTSALAPSTTYTVALTPSIVDEASPPNALVATSWSFTTAGAAPPITVFHPVADSKVNASSPSNNYGTETTLRVRAPSPEWRTYLAFEVSGLSAPVTGAHLRLFATDGSDQAGRVFSVASAWTESGITWGNAPPISGAPLVVGGSVGDGAWIELDLGAAVTGNGTFAFALTSTSTNSTYFSSREGLQPPELVITTEPVLNTTPPTRPRSPGPDPTSIRSTGVSSAVGAERSEP